MAADNLMSFCLFKILYLILENGYPVLDQESQNHGPVGSSYPYRYCGGVPLGGLCLPVEDDCFLVSFTCWCNFPNWCSGCFCAVVYRKMASHTVTSPVITPCLDPKDLAMVAQSRTLTKSMSADDKPQLSEVLATEISKRCNFPFYHTQIYRSANQKLCLPS